MLKIEGFVCSAVDMFSKPPFENLFGVNRGKGLETYEALRSNELTLFGHLTQARVAQTNLQRRLDLRDISVGQLRMLLAEKDQEHPSLQDGTQFIVVARLDGNLEFIGRPVESSERMGYIPGSILGSNGINPFLDFNSALRSRNEAIRQAASAAQISTFDLELI